MAYRKPGERVVEIGSGQTTSAVVRLGEYGLVGLIIPAAFTGTAITFTACRTKDGTFMPVYDSDGNQVSVAVAVSRAVGLSAAEADALAPFHYIKLVSNGSEVADRSIDMVLK